MANKFDWLASESAPKSYPMKVIRGHFYDPEDGSLYVPDGKLLYHGWGEGQSTHVVGPDLKALPNRLEITFFSYLEDQFYQGSFDLPYERIVELFNSPYYSHKVEEEINYHWIIAGVAPGGVVTVWVESIDRTVEVFSGEAEKVDLDWSNVTTYQEVSRAEWIEEQVEYTRSRLSSEEVEELIERGVPADLWQAYRTRYDWQPLFSGQEPPENIGFIRYFNGERDLIELPLNERFLNRNHAVPKEVHFVWDWPKGRPLLIELMFDEQEIRTAFDELGETGEPFFMEFHMKDWDGSRVMNALVQNDKKQVLLRKTKLKTYGVRK